MTPLHLSIFDHLKQSGISDETLKRLEKLINDLPELESFRKMSHDLAMLKILSSANM